VPVSPRSDPGFDPETYLPRPSLIARRIMQHPRVIREATTCAGQSEKMLVLALVDEVLVLKPKGKKNSGLDGQLAAAGYRYIGSLRGSAHANEASHIVDVQVWHTSDPKAPDSTTLARSLRTDTSLPGIAQKVATVTPNHVCVVCANYDTCPGGPPMPICDKVDIAIPPLKPPGVQVVVIDTGLMTHPALAGRASAEVGYWLDPTSGWLASPPDDVSVLDDMLPGVAGHGTHIAGVIAARCAHAKVSVVGLRHECYAVPTVASTVDEERLFTSEIAVANAVRTHSRASVISCGFAFPTLDCYPSLPFAVTLSTIGAELAIVAPAGNEATSCPYWPAAFQRVIGVGATRGDMSARADFSNYGNWVDVFAPGEDVTSTFPTVDALPEDFERAPWISPCGWHYTGWASWSGTSFATPKVAAAIACVSVERMISPVAAYELIVSGGVPAIGVDTITPPDAAAFRQVKLA
jgi:subtilisin family serine protease